MCVLLIGYRLRRERPLVIAANRDESYDRPAAPPERVDCGPWDAIMPRDLRAGGTWLGLTTTGLTLVITNRPDGDFDPARPSRGQLCRRMLACPNAEEVGELLQRTLKTERYNSFNLLHADGHSAWVSSWNGRLRSVELEPGTHALSNAHGLGELQVPELGELPWQEGDWSDLRQGLIRLLGSARERDANGYRIFKQGERYGTVSSSLIRHEARDEVVLEYSATPGPPRSADFRVFRLPLITTERSAEAERDS